MKTDLGPTILYLFANDRSTVEIEGTEVEFLMENPIEFSRFFSLSGEETIISDLLLRIESDDVFYDIGANVGVYSCFVAKSIPDSTVVAFEPFPRNVRRFRENMALNDVTSMVLSTALSNFDGETELHLQGDSPGTGEHSIRDGDSANAIDVTVSRGDRLIKREKIPEPTVVKIDVEGEELNVIRGMENTLSSKSCRLVYCEIHSQQLEERGDGPDDVCNLLESLGFTIKVLTDPDGRYHIRASKDG